MTKINREQLRQMISETMGDHIKVRNFAHEVIGEELPEPMVQGTFEIRPEALNGMADADQGFVLTLSGPDGVATKRLTEEDLRRGTFVIDIGDIVSMDIPK